MSYKLSRDLLAQTLDAFATTNSISVAWENIDFEKEVVDEYLEFFVLFSTPDNQFLAGGDRILGVFQINIYTPKDIGIGRSYALVDLLETYYADNKFKDSVNNFYIYIDKFYLGNNGENTIEQNKTKQVINIDFEAWRT